jgi:hypothetical protein
MIEKVLWAIKHDLSIIFDIGLEVMLEILRVIF